MPTVQFRVSGSAAEPYVVTFDLSEGRVLAFCTCAAGQSGQACKHRTSLLDGDASSALEPDHEALAHIRSSLPGTPLATALQALADAEAALEAARRTVTGARKAVAVAMRG